MKILLHIPLSTYSGYGNDGIGLTQALLRAGVDVYLMPNAVQAPLPREVAELLTKPLQAPFDMIISHVDPMALEATESLRTGTEMLVGWTMWEYSNLRNAPRRSSMRRRWKNFDALVGYDEVTRDGLAEHYKGPIIVQQGGFNPQDWQPVERDWDDPRFFFCQIGVLTERKDPFVSIAAFRDAREEDPEFAEFARLSLKTSVPGLHSKMEDVFPGLRIFYDAWPQATVRDFYQANHVLLAPSRGEGKNMPALEFMSTGGTVIATNWGGHTQWLHPDYAYPLDYSLAPVSPEFPGTLNARASVEHLKQTMLHCFHNRHEVRAKGQIASAVIPSMCSWDAVVVRLFDKIRELGSKGERLHEAFVSAQAEAAEQQTGWDF